METEIKNFIPDKGIFVFIKFQKSIYPYHSFKVTMDHKDWKVLEKKEERDQKEIVEII